MHELIPYSPVPGIKLSGELRREGKLLHFHFALKTLNAIRDTIQPGLNTVFTRADELWKTTCFEFFFAPVKDHSSYYEFNLSARKPQWNLYRFHAYREPTPPLPSDYLELVKTTASESSIEGSLQAKADLPELNASLCAILRTDSGANYFATAHKRQKPDFHARESFVLTV